MKLNENDFKFYFEINQYIKNLCLIYSYINIITDEDENINIKLEYRREIKNNKIIFDKLKSYEKMKNIMLEYINNHLSNYFYTREGYKKIEKIYPIDNIHMGIEDYLIRINPSNLKKSIITNCHIFDELEI